MMRDKTRCSKLSDVVCVYVYTQHFHTHAHKELAGLLAVCASLAECRRTNATYAHAHKEFVSLQSILMISHSGVANCVSLSR